MNLKFLTTTMLFRGATEAEAQEMLSCLGAAEKQYDKGETIYHAGEYAQNMGLVISGSVMIEISDLWGNVTVLSCVEPGQLFAETYACVPNEPLMVNVRAGEKCSVLFLNAARIISTCQNSCAHHARLIQNLLQISAKKNLALSRRSVHTAPKTIRGRLLSYLSEQGKLSGGYHFTIPYNRQQLADYLGVDRSALSKELSKMQDDGILTYKKNAFTLTR